MPRRRFFFFYIFGQEAPGVHRTDLCLWYLWRVLDAVSGLLSSPPGDNVLLSLQSDKRTLALLWPDSAAKGRAGEAPAPQQTKSTGGETQGKKKE